jgi:hypothetical protein
MQNIQLDQSLKLTQCPRCDYSLQGSPEIGICPECGDAYNTDFLILRGKPVTLGDEPNGQRNFSIFASVGWVILMGALWVSAHTGFPTPFIILLAVYSAVELTQSLVPWFASTRRGDVLVWLSSAGIGEQPFVDADSLAGRYLHFSNLLQAVTFLPVTIALVCIVFSPDNAVIGIILFFVLLFPCYLIYLGRKPTPALRSSGIRPALLPWNAFGEIEIEELGGRSFQFWARKLDSTRIRSSDVIKIEFSASSAGGTQLLYLLRQWCDQRVPVSFKPLDRSPGPRWARAAGLAVNRVIGPKPEPEANEHGS